MGEKLCQWCYNRIVINNMLKLINCKLSVLKRYDVSTFFISPRLYTLVCTPICRSRINGFFMKLMIIPDSYSDD